MINAENGTIENLMPMLVFQNELLTTKARIICNPFDKSIFAFLQFDKLLIFHSERARIVCSLEAKASVFPNSMWEKAIFISSKTILVITTAGEFALYFLGIENNLFDCHASELPPDSIVLVSDGSNAVYVPRLDISSPAGTSFICIAMSSKQDQNIKHITYVPADSGKSDYHQHIVQFGNGSIDNSQVNVATFWASLFGSNITQVSDSRNTSTYPLFLPFIHGSYIEN